IDYLALYQDGGREFPVGVPDQNPVAFPARIDVIQHQQAGSALSHRKRLSVTCARTRRGVQVCIAGMQSGFTVDSQVVGGAVTADGLDPVFKNRVAGRRIFLSEKHPVVIILNAEGGYFKYDQPIGRRTERIPDGVYFSRKEMGRSLVSIEFLHPSGSARAFRKHVLKNRVARRRIFLSEKPPVVIILNAEGGYFKYDQRIGRGTERIPDGVYFSRREMARSLVSIEFLHPSGSARAFPVHVFPSRYQFDRVHAIAVPGSRPIRCHRGLSPG